MYNPLIYGKNSLERVVSCEVHENQIELFIEDADGTVRSEFKPHKYWLCAPVLADSGFHRLTGDNFYRYIKFYEDKETFKQDRYKYYKNDIYFMSDEKEAAMVAYGFTYYKGMKLNDVSVLSFDIETNGLTLNKDSYLFIISNTYRRNGMLVRKMFSADEYDSQGELIDAWCAWVREMNPSIMLGHNIYGFDIGYLNHVALKSDTKLYLGRDGSEIRIAEKDSKFRKDGSQSYEFKRVFIHGREVVDTMFVSFKYDFSRKYPSYGLKAIIKYEKLEIEGRQFYDAGSIKDNWDNLEERAKIKAYAEHDADDALALYDLMIPSFFYLTQTVPKSFQAINYTATGSQINSFLIRSYLQDFHSIPKASQMTKFEGAISFGVPGVYKNVMKIDYASLYPSIIREYKIFDKYKDPKGHFLQMVEYFTLERLRNKKLAKETDDQYYKDMSEMGKIFINSSYGLLGATGLNFNNGYHAAFVTRKGRELLEYSIEWATSKKVKYWQDLFEEKTK